MTAIVSLEDLTYRYPGAAAPALRDVSLQIAPGEYLVEIQATGEGGNAKELVGFRVTA